jgi:hypothetical protein
MRVFVFAFLLLSAGLARADGPAIDGPAEVKPGGFARLTAGGGLPVLWHVEPEPVQADDGRPGEVTFTGVPGTEYKVTADVFDFKAGAATRIRKTVKFLPFAGLQMRPAMALPPAAPPALTAGRRTASQGRPAARRPDAGRPGGPGGADRAGREAGPGEGERRGPFRPPAGVPHHAGHDCPNCGYTSPAGQGTWLVRGYAADGEHVHQCPRCGQSWKHGR